MIEFNKDKSIVDISCWNVYGFIINIISFMSCSLKFELVGIGLFDLYRNLMRFFGC